MKRDFDTIYVRNQRNGYSIGDEAAHRAAAALADRADAPTIQALTDMLSFLELIGGQFHVVSVREKYDRFDNRVAADDDGKWVTDGLVFNYETRDLRIIEAPSPETALGLPVTDSNGPPTIVDAPEEPLPPEMAEMLRNALANAEQEPEDIEEPAEDKDEEKAVALSE